ncbi:L-2-amino-thiazoline-4-carboxylic acid hydrolase [Lacibacterium aquatile]|uniref:L-2-amino-thiazoline-4-carboxylic acid hydrolase n=1 Tax=Lacibacterium aquatile TaxID=1168082 RepID=A0ABW5DX47_9PROT
MTVSNERLARELEDAFKNRAFLYQDLLAELSADLGREKALELLAKAIERRGKGVAAAAFKNFGPKDALAVGEAFLAVSPNGGAMYPTEVTRHADGIDICVQRCPLLDAWQSSGADAEEVATLCKLAGAFDKGLFEGVGLKFSAETWTEGHKGCCHIHLRDGS